MFEAKDLENIPVMRCLSERQRAHFADVAADVKVCPGDWLLREGESPSFFVIVSGSFDVLREMNGQQEILKRYNAGDFVGELFLLLSAPSTASFRAREASRVMRLDRLQFKDLIDCSAECSALIMKTMSDRVSMIQEYVLERPASRVLVIGSQYDVDCRDIRSFLSINRIPFEWVDRAREPDRVPSCMPADMNGPAVVIDGNTCVGQPPTVRKVAEALGFCTTPAKQHYDVVVVGAGPAGLAAAVYGSSEGLNVLLIERSTVGGQAGTSSRIENYLGFPAGISGDELSERAVKQATRFGTEIVMTREVRNVYPLNGTANGGYCVELDEGERVTATCVVLATGVDWRRLHAEGVERLQGRGVLYGASRTESSTVNGKNIFIVGGGNSAGQAAMFFSSYARSVTVLVRGAGLNLTMSQYLIEQLERRANVKIEPFTEVVSVDGESNLESICTSTHGEAPVQRPADALFIMIGADANTDWLPGQLQRDEKGYVCTGRDLPEGSCGNRQPYLLETNLPGFFCVGDVRHDSIKRVSSSVGEGSMAIAFVHQYLAMKDQPASAQPILV